MRSDRTTALGPTVALLALALTACGGDPTPRPTETHTSGSHARAEKQAAPEEAPNADAPNADAPNADAPNAEAEPVASPEPAPRPAEGVEPDFDAPLPEEPCPPVRVRLAHRSDGDLPPLLTEAVAFRSEDGRHLRVVLSNRPLEQDALGRFPEPTPGHARFEMDAIRWRRGPIEPRVLGTTDSRRGALTHARIVGAGPRSTFGNRDIGRVELTEVSPTRVCGRIDLDDGFGRVRGGFTAPLEGALPR